MAVCLNAIVCGAVVAAGCVLAGTSTSAQQPSITTAGITLQSVGVTWPSGDRMFPGGAAADAINANCTACHSAGMVLTQPALTRAAWLAEVDKMRNTYKAPIAAEDVPAIVAYLTSMKVAK